MKLKQSKQIAREYNNKHPVESFTEIGLKILYHHIITGKPVRLKKYRDKIQVYPK